MTDETPLFSMVVATYGRADELARLFNSLTAQTASRFEVIVVDQNADDRVKNVLERTRVSFPVTHVRIAPQGVNYARNEGAKIAKGKWLLFPDDDCWYPNDFLEKTLRLMQKTKADLYSGRAINEAGKTIMGKFPDEPVGLNRDTVWITMIEWMTVFRASVFRQSGGFDPQIGPGSGSPFGACEIQDIALHCLSNGATGIYDPALCGYHPEDVSDRASPANIAKMRLYSQGQGLVMHRHGFSFSHFLPTLLRPMAGMIVYALTLKFNMARRSTAIWQGRLYGWTHFKPE